MRKERYKPADNQWIAHSEIDVMAVADAIHDDIGAKFPITWVDGEPIIDFDDLPEGVKENQVKNAVRNHHPWR